MSREDHVPLLERARGLLHRNTVSTDATTYTAPSPPHYSDQWNWDSRLVARVWARIDPSRAAAELSSLFASVGARGELPVRVAAGGSAPALDVRGRLEQGLSRMVHGAAPLTQPPVPVLDMAEQVVEDPELLRSMLDAETRHLDWLAAHRADRDGLLSILHPWESGMDAKPSYDGVGGFDGRTPLRASVSLTVRTIVSGHRHGWDAKRMRVARRFAVKDVLFNSMYAANLRTTAAIHRRIGNRDVADRLRSRADRVASSMVEHMFDDHTGVFFDLGPSDEFLEVRTVAGLTPLVVPGLPRDVADRLVDDHLLDPVGFWTDHPLPSVAADEPSYRPDRGWPLWRGPTWINTNYIVWHGLKQHGRTREASELARRTREMVDREGFHEFYDPHTGAALRPRTNGFAWSTLAALMDE